MDAMEAKMNEWRRRMPSKRALTSQLGQFVQQKSVAVLYTQSEQERIKNVTELIQRATNEFEKEEPWDRIMKVVDVVSNTANKHVLKEAIRYVRLRLGDPSPRVILLTLSLTEALMKNCNRYVHKEIGSEAFMSEMESLYKVHSCKRGRDSMEIEGRVLELIQTWGESFMNQKFEFPYFIYTYEKLRKKGVRFPKFDKTKAPIFNAGVGSSSYSSGPVASRMRSSSSSSNSSRSGASGSLAKLSSKEVYHVATNVSEMFEDMIHEVERDGVTPSSLNSGVIVELAVQAQELLVRLQAVIQSAADNESDEDLGRYLAVNDSLHTAITRYEDLKSGKANNNQNGHASKKVPSSSNQFDNDDDDDDGFGDFVRARVGGDSKPAAAVKSNQVDNDDEDPFASFVQQRTTKTVEETKAPAPAKNLIDLWDDAPAQPTVTQPLAPAAPATPLVADLWDASNDLLAPAAPAAVVAAPAPAPAPVAKPQTSAFDDIWGDLATPSPAPVVAPLQPAQPAFVPAPSAAPTMNGNAAAANPFDFFDDFSTKATISAPVTQPAVAPVTKANPFDFGFPPPPAQTQAALPQSKPSATLNPFDF